MELGVGLGGREACRQGQAFEARKPKEGSWIVVMFQTYKVYIFGWFAAGTSERKHSQSGQTTVSYSRSSAGST